MSFEYSVSIAWSSEDGAYLASIFELPGCRADGATAEEALQNVRQIAQEWIEVAKEEGRPVPQPLSVQDIERVGQQAYAAANLAIQQKISSAVADWLRQISEQGETWTRPRPLAELSNQ